MAVTVRIVSLHLFVLSLVLRRSSSSDERRTTERQTSLGQIRGYSEDVLGVSVDSYLGIPYGIPPVGERRFRAPEPSGKWSGTLDATRLPNSCPQPVFPDYTFEGVTMWNPNTELNEDCLYLNIWSPSSEPSEPRAVLVWIFGGGFVTGTSTLPLYDGRILASLGDVIVVSMQYRLGALGFLYVDDPDTPPNVGLLDQVLALRWVKDNIASYGGDPARVTLFGESAGGVSVGFHLLSPMSENLFDQAILQSAAPGADWSLYSVEQAREVTSKIAQSVGCGLLSGRELKHCLLNIPVENLMGNSFAGAFSFLGAIVAPFAATMGGEFLPKSPSEIIKENDFKQAKILLGVNSNEGAYFLPFGVSDVYTREAATINSEATFAKTVASVLDAQHNDLITKAAVFEYSVPCNYNQPERDYANTLDAILGDKSFTCSVVSFAKAIASREDSEVYFYKFSQDLSSNPWPDWMGVLHGYEIDSVFGLGQNMSLTSYTNQEREFTKRVALHWLNFAKTGDPSLTAGQVPTAYTWPKYTLDERNVLVLNETKPAPVLNGYKDRECEFWKDLAPAIMEQMMEQNGAAQLYLPTISIILPTVFARIIT